LHEDIRQIERGKKTTGQECGYHAKNNESDQRFLARPIQPLGLLPPSCDDGLVQALFVEAVGAVDTGDDPAVTERQHRVTQICQLGEIAR